MPFFGQNMAGPVPPFATDAPEPVPRPKEPVQLADGVFEDFPFGEKRHFNERANNQQALGPGLTVTGEERQQFAHINRQNDGFVQSEQWHEDPRATSSQAMSTYQAQCQGGRDHDDVGKVKIFKPGKKVLNPGHTHGHAQGVSPVLNSGPLQSRSTMAAYDPSAVGTLRGEAGHLPGYSGHVSKVAPSGEVAPRNSDKSLPLLTQNYRTKIPGYTGVKK